MKTSKILKWFGESPIPGHIGAMNMWCGPLDAMLDRMQSKALLDGLAVFLTIEDIAF
jgi:hypothetical protein